MLPDNVLSRRPIPSDFIGARASVYPSDVDYIEGPIALNDPSRGLEYQLWKAEVIRETNSNRIEISAPNLAPLTIYEGNRVTEVSLAFNHSASPVLAFADEGAFSFLYYNSSVNLYVVESLPEGSTSAKVALDDLRGNQGQNSDVILAYLREGKLYHRRQRDRYGVEMLLDDGPWGSLVRVGRGANFRLQFQVV